MDVSASKKSKPLGYGEQKVYPLSFIFGSTERTMSRLALQSVANRGQYDLDNDLVVYHSLWYCQL